LNLAVFFATKVLLPDGRSLDVFALVMAIGAYLLMWRLHWQVYYLVPAGAVLGALWTVGRPTLGI